MRRHTHQLELLPPTHAGKRAGAGRKPTPGRRPGVPHRPRPIHDARCPAHVTLRVRPGLPSLREDHLFGAVSRALSAASRGRFRVPHFSVQADHLHLVVEADMPTGLSRGIQGLAIRVAKAVNRVLRRHGGVWADRHHVRSLSTPREVRNALVYVLNNWRRHVSGARGLDGRSSARWFDGWRTPVARPECPAPVAIAHTWLMRIGWRRYGPIDAGEAPAHA